MNSITNEIVIASISDGVIQTNDITGVCNFAPSIVVVIRYHCAGSIYNAHNVALQILHIVILRSVIDERVRTSAFVIKEIHIIGSPSLTNEQTVNIVIIIYRTANSFLCSQSVRTVLETQKFFGWQASPKRRCLPLTK